MIMRQLWKRKRLDHARLDLPRPSQWGKNEANAHGQTSCISYLHINSINSCLPDYAWHIELLTRSWAPRPPTSGYPMTSSRNLFMPLFLLDTIQAAEDMAAMCPDRLKHGEGRRKDVWDILVLRDTMARHHYSTPR